ncbi:sterol 3-beta-glucosyltransferase UGT80A2 isoform X4 [Arachis ipaensis]|uniref:sterol 3-beta-glucosyltransferase UGT80A2 isoform X4 n=1 Tax=Arachis ipaensis TaxID=130454 RepID=UPI0007AF3FDF|nr:sterol 3-beta-glucosyltransferase UGT80A2 isoform X4 [Arachis ipaensis]
MAESSSNTRLSNSSDEVSVYLDAEPRSTTDIATTSSSSGHVDRDTSTTRHSLAEVMAMAEAEAERAPTRHSRYHRQKSATKVRKNTGIGSIMKFLDENLPAKKRLRFLKRASVIKDDGTVEFDVPRDIKPPENIGTTVTSRELCNESGEATPYYDIHPLQIVMLIVGTRGDVQPFVAIGKRLQEDGHRVRLASHKNFKDFVLSAGLEFYPLGGDPKVLAGYMVKNKGFLPSGRSEIHKQRNQIKAIINSLLPACNSADPDTHVAFNADAIIANPPAYGHTHVAEFLKVPLHIFFTMPWTPTNEFPHPLSRVKQQIAYRLSYQIVDSLIWLGIRDLINEFRKKKLKLRPITYLSGYYTSPPNMPYGYIWSPHLVPKPKDWGPNIDVVGFCFLDLASDYEPPISLLEWLEEGEKEGKKPIYIGFGSLVHHGGAGTTAAGLRAACPTTIVPFFGDQPFWGERVHARGVGPAPIPVDEFTLGRLVDAINYMLKPEVIYIYICDQSG